MKLGCSQPGESVATFGDALRRLADNSVHLYATKEGIGTHCNQALQDWPKTSKQQEEADINAEIIRRLRSDSNRGDFDGWHIAPDSTADIPDEITTRLVILGPEYLQELMTRNLML